LTHIFEVLLSARPRSGQYNGRYVPKEGYTDWILAPHNVEASANRPRAPSFADQISIWLLTNLSKKIL